MLNWLSVVLFLVGAVLLLYFYILTFRYLYLGFLYLSRQIRRFQQWVSNLFVLDEFKVSIEKVMFRDYAVSRWSLSNNKKIHYLISAILVIFVVTTFVKSWSLYASEPYKHHEAKRIYAAVSAPAKFRQGIASVFGADWKLLKPIEWYLYAAIKVGKNYLPEDDGEAYIWEQQLIFNPYIHSFRFPSDYDWKRHNQRFNQVYKRFLIVLNHEMHDEVSDSKFFASTVKKDIITMLAVADYYQPNQDNLRLNSSWMLDMINHDFYIETLKKDPVKNKHFIEIWDDIPRIDPKYYHDQIRDLYNYVNQVQRWIDSNELPTSVQNSPAKIALFYKTKINLIQARLILYTLTEPFNCNSPYISEYFQAQTILLEYLKKYPSLNYDFYTVYMRKASIQIDNWISEHYCGIENNIVLKDIEQGITSASPLTDLMQNRIREQIGYDMQEHAHDKKLQPLFNALKAKDTFRIKKLIQEQNLDINLRFFGEKTPLHYSAYWRDANTSRILLELGADINSTDKAGKIPLQYAIETLGTDVVKLLLEHGSSRKWVPEVRNTMTRGQYNWYFKLLWENPIYYVSIVGNGVMLQETLNATEWEVTHQQVAELCKTLIRHDMGAKGVISFRKGYTSMLSSMIGTEITDKSEIIRLMLEAGADPFFKDHRNKTPYDLALFYNRDKNETLMDSYWYDIVEPFTPYL